MENLKIIESELVPVYETDKGEKVVYGLELHEALKVKSNYREWIARRFGDIEAVENKDFEAVEIPTPSGQAKKNHIIKLNTAKEMAMLERNEKGKQVRRYFIKVEEKYKENLKEGIESNRAGTSIRLYKNNKWYILTIGDEVYNLAPDEAKTIDRAVWAMGKNGVSQVVEVTRTMLDTFKRECRLNCVRECTVNNKDKALEDKSSGRDGAGE